MAASTIIRQLLIEREISIKDFSEMYGMPYQSMRNKLSRNTFTFKEMLDVAELLGCDIEFITRDTKKSFKVTKSGINTD